VLAVGRSPSGRLPTQTAPFRGSAPVSAAVSLACSRRALRVVAGPLSQPTAPICGTLAAESPVSQPAVPMPLLARACLACRSLASRASPTGVALPPGSNAGESSSGLKLTPSATAILTAANMTTGLSTTS